MYYGGPERPGPGTRHKIQPLLFLRFASRRSLVLAKALQYQQHRSNKNTGIRDVESGPMIGSDIKIKEIDYVSERYAIPQITQRPAQYQAKRNTE
jgi:hypothetical protein